MPCPDALWLLSIGEIYLNGIICAFAYNYWIKEIKPLAITYGALALLFQPFVKVALGRAMWNVTDVVVALGLIGIYLYENNKASN